MDNFKLRLPTIADWESVWTCIPPSEREKLHWRTPGGFHLTASDKDDTDCHCVANDREMDGRYAVVSSDCPLPFRPVLEAEDDISCLKDGSIIQMGNFMIGPKVIPVPLAGAAAQPFPEPNKFGGPTLGLNPYNTEGVEPISWIKCGNILMADRPLLSNLSYDRLKNWNLVEGVSMNTPFQVVVANYFYDLSLSQPYSPQRKLGDIMADLHRELDYNGVKNIPSRDVLFAISSRINESWLNDDNIDLYRAVLAVSRMLTQGLENLYYYNRDNEHCIGEFSSDVVRKVLSTCLQDEFDILLYDTMDCAIKRNTNDMHGHLTPLGRVVNRLETAEKNQTKELNSLLQSAKAQAGKTSAKAGKAPEKNR